MTVLECDVAIIGAGTAGLAAERNARRHGAKTLLIDPYFAGTVCATVGCMPSKLLIAAARRAHQVRGAETFGISASDIHVDGEAVMMRLRKHRDHFAQSTRDSINDLPEEIRVQARARFAGPTTLELDNGQTVQAKTIVIATGSEPSIPAPYQDLGDAVLTNQTVFELRDLPDRLAVIGAGVIGVELAQAFARLGVEVALFDAGERLAGARHDDVHGALYDALSADVTLHLGQTPEPELVDGEVKLTWEGGAASYDRVLVAAGRPPSLKGLNLEQSGLFLDEDGMPEVDRLTLQCGDAPIFLAGDANGDRPILHEASDEGGIAGLNAAAYPAVIPSSREVAFSITFSEPAMVSVGTGAESADFTATADYSDQGRAVVEDENQGLAVLYAAAPDGRVIGADLCCPGADHLGHLLIWAISQGMTAHDLLTMPIYHPTLEEGLKPALHDICHSAEIAMRSDRDTGIPAGA
ncbi:dihydrolipoyl dehydrogenase [Donghicola sp. XS_ASV15]|uniref:dihydrolipoyl dehydrogenase n=1 Tax=Donghicola sp. XS_ASV15 TaxID=3241295 RepID=UPI00351596A6